MNNFLCVNAQMYKFELQKTIHARKTLAVIVKDDSTTINRQTKNEKKSQRFKKTKEVQPHPQADTRLHHICFFPTAPKCIFVI